MRSTGNGKHRTSCDWGVRCFMQTALRRKTETGNEKDPSAALGMTKRGSISHIVFQSHSGNQPLPLRGTSFRGKEGKRLFYSKAAFPASSFRANARNLFRWRSGRSERTAENGKHRTACDWESRCFMQTALRRKTETGNEKDPSAALGMTKRGNVSSHFFLFYFHRKEHS